LPFPPFSINFDFFYNLESPAQIGISLLLSWRRGYGGGTHYLVLFFLDYSLIVLFYLGLDSVEFLETQFVYFGEGLERPELTFVVSKLAGKVVDFCGFLFVEDET
jgi:hypothetical protein